MAGDLYKRLPEELSRAVNKYYPNGGRPRITPINSHHNPNFRKDRNASICQSRTKGLSYKELAIKYELKIITIKKILKANNLTTKHERMNIDEEIRVMRGMDMPKRKIAKKLGISHTTLYNHMKREGLK